MGRQTYTLTSTWRIAAARERCWAALADPSMSWPLWWPGVSATSVSPAGGLVGSTAVVTFRAPGGYRLRLELEATEAVPHRRAVLRAGGDLVGSARVELAAAGPEATRVTTVWEVEPTKDWMRVGAPVLGGVFAASHARVMRAGERGLARYLAAPA